jgi:uncharacterized membrane protein YdjX (TVP38/TMEM64 family)
MPDSPEPRPAADAGTPSGPPSPAGRPRSARHLLLFGVKRHKRALWITGSIALAVIAGFALFLGLTDIEWATVSGAVNEAINRLPPLAVLPVMAILPIFGFPIAVVYLFAGARFGPLGGGAVVAGITAIHLLGTYVIARSFLRAPLERFIARRHAHLPQVPEDEQVAVAVIATLVPGLPYFVRNYALVLAGVRLRVLFWVCLPIYTARSYVSILLGDMSSDPSRNKFLILAAVDVLKVAICALVIWRLREHHRKYHGHEHDPVPGSDVPAQPNAAGK